MKGINITITFGMHSGIPFTYGLYMTNGTEFIHRIFDKEVFRFELQRSLKQGLKLFAGLDKNQGRL